MYLKWLSSSALKDKSNVQRDNSEAQEGKGNSEELFFSDELLADGC